MERPEKHIPKILEEALDELRRNPGRAVHARIDGLEVEMRVVARTIDQSKLGDRLAAMGPWEGETTDEILRILREARDRGSAEPPSGP